MQYTEFKKDLDSKLSKRLDVKNVHQIPHIDKVIVSIGVGSLHTRKGVKDFSEFEKNLTAITGQKPTMVMSKKNVSNFKLREGMPSMMTVTLRGKKAHYFLFKLMSIVLPRVRDFAGLSNKSFDHHGNYSLGLKSYEIFPELHPDSISLPTGLQVTIATDSRKKEDTKALLEEYGFVFHA
ncbi:50S ribosomal protein L5 [candidate division SR1 bacterium Aalborg_AAW-1]|nr:50S ribosomal protein L5 [candidate division SR1 bacterium Aalborg_AAW-1]